MNPPLCILTIAGSDSGGGAGIQADQRTICSLGGHALTAVTAVTAQDTKRVVAWTPVTDKMICAQVDSALRGFAVTAVKTGLLPGAGAVRAVAGILARGPSVPLVVDPVLSSSSGTQFLDKAGVRAMQRYLFPIAALITPNWPEAEILSGRRVRSHAQAELAAEEIAASSGLAVLVKGGHAAKGPCRDCLAAPGAATIWFESKRVHSDNTHGTGCVLSAAIATWLGRGTGIAEAVLRSRSFLHAALVEGRLSDWGGGRGPAHHGAL